VERDLRRLTGLPVTLDACRDPAAAGEALDADWDEIRCHGRAAASRVAAEPMAHGQVERLGAMADGLIDAALKEMRLPALACPQR